MDVRASVVAAVFALSCAALVGCNRPALSPSADHVTVSIIAPPASCERVASVRGRAGSQWESHPLAVQDGALLTYAMNDLRNEAARHGADYVHRSEPTLSAPWGRITTAEYAGIGYRCSPRARAVAQAR